MMVRVLTVISTLAAVGVVASSSPGGATVPNSVVTVDPDLREDGQYSSLVLDGNGYPVISYKGTEGLSVVHCNDVNCGGFDDIVETVDSLVGKHTSLALDDDGFPVVSYYGVSGDLRVVHCNDPSCAGGDDNIEIVDSVGDVGAYTSLELDASGFPVVSYFDGEIGALKVVHCNDANCAGSDESIETVDSGGVGAYTSLELDASGFPVISYRDYVNADLKVVHCNDANCAGGDDSLEIVDSVGDVGEYTSLALDANDYPVVSYYDATNEDLKVAHCNDPNCAGSDDSLENLDSTGRRGLYTSLALDAEGFPVVSYYDGNNGALKVARCYDPNCASAGYVTVDDTRKKVGRFTSLALDAEGFPVISYFSLTDFDLKLAHCVSPTCDETAPTLQCPSPAATVPFDDMDTASVSHQEDIVCIHELGVTAGTSPTTYSPSANVTRQQMASFLARLYESITGAPAPVVAVPFNDMDTASPSHRDDIARIYGLEITTGTSPITYMPLANVTRQQMASFLARLYESITGEVAPIVPTPFHIVAEETSSSHVHDITRIYGLGITTGTSPTTYSPLDDVTRQQMASFLARFYRCDVE
jgi:hypothetical protein